MRTRRSYFPPANTIPRRSRRQTTNVVESEIRTNITMADNRTMAQMLQAPIEGYEDAIVVPQINANNFELKQTLINLVPNTTIKLLLFPFSLEGEARIWLDKEPPRSILTWEDLVSKFINQFFSPSKTTYLRNEIINFLQKPNETFNEAWERFKNLLRQCPHHGFSELHQLDTFYNALNPNDQDALDSAAGENFLDKIPRKCLSIIESKSKVRYSRSRVTDVRAKTNAPLPSSSHLNSFDLQQIDASLEDKLDIRMNRFEKSLNDMKNSFITPTAPLKAVEENLYNNKPSSLSSLPSNTIPNPKVEAKAITTMSGMSYKEPPIPPSGVDQQEPTEVTTDTELPSPEDIQPPLVQVEFAPMFKKLLNNKDKLIELTKTPLNENCSAVVLKKLSEKLGDPGRFLIPCDFLEFDNCLALADLEASINLMPLSIWKKLRLPTLNDTKMVLELADRTISKPSGVAENIFVKVEPPEVELKELPPHMEYAFLGENEKWPVIIAKDLNVNKKSTLINVLKLRKKAIAWKLTNIRGIDPKFCSHKILLEEDFSPKVQSQRRPLGWRVCIDYMKLNEATRKDHFPLLFMDQMLERLAGNEYYCFLDRFSGYFQIPIDPKDQEKTTFTCPYETFAYKRMPFGRCNAPGTFQRCMMPFELMCDASDYDVGAVLGQRVEKHFRTIHYAIKTMNQAEMNYTTTEKEMLAVVYAFEKFRSYLIINKSIVYTDHSALKYLFTKKDAKARLLRWILLLQEFDFKVINTKGAKNYAADHLSRLENPYEKIFDPKEINETFPLESLNKIAHQDPIDYLSRWVEANALPTNDARVVVKILKSLFSQFGTPKAIISHIGTHFCNDQFARVMSKYGVTHRLSTAYHPQTSGQVEVTNRGLKRILERTVGENPALWSDKLEDALWAFRTAFKTPVGCTPYRLVYEKACHLPLKLEHKAFWALKHANFDLKTAGDHRKLARRRHRVWQEGSTCTLQEQDLSSQGRQRAAQTSLSDHRIRHVLNQDHQYIDETSGMGQLVVPVYFNHPGAGMKLAKIIELITTQPRESYIADFNQIHNILMKENLTSTYMGKTIKVEYNHQTVKFQLPFSAKLLDLQKQVTMRFKGWENKTLCIKYEDNNRIRHSILCDNELEICIAESITN
uniref:RNA-directed DNA polymerase n=1 Tax=Tanacetum cinerariifolium TaxID=118510 RepID=A0A6L2JJF7_TANCI|nr:hypothetical protein [Tanacetum cinerariifolium]